MDISGYVVLGIVTLFLTYLVPQLIRDRQDLADCRLSDRFSADLRILTTAGVPGSGVPVPAVVGPSRTYLHGPRLRTEVSAMNRPPLHLASSPSTRPGGPRASVAPRPAGPRGREVGDAATRDAGRRRRAAARRRLTLTLVLLGLTVWAWAAVATNAAPVVLAAAPTVLLAVVLLLGRRAAAAAARAGARSRAQRSAPRPVFAGTSAGATGTGTPARRPERSQPRAAAPGSALPPVTASSRREVPAMRDATTEVLPRPVEHRVPGAGDAPVGDERRQGGVGQARVARADGAAGERVPASPDGDAAARSDLLARAEREPRPDLSRSWTPVPVPAPTYTLKPSAPRATRRPATPEPAEDAAVRARVPEVPEAEGRQMAPQAPGVDTTPVRGTGEGSEASLAEPTSGGVAVAAPAAAAGREEEVPPAAHLDLDAVLNRRRAAGE